ncbi:MAG: hypothetical protein HC899_38055 [Leptolyngbyaceae cyanobacterium SM1_4_3]|nr:hypothetical protein [Leptolyngbyaceae cyanobacterium SM1_4_3]
MQRRSLSLAIAFFASMVLPFLQPQKGRSQTAPTITYRNNVGAVTSSTLTDFSAGTSVNSAGTNAFVSATPSVYSYVNSITVSSSNAANLNGALFKCWAQMGRPR